MSASNQSLNISSLEIAIGLFNSRSKIETLRPAQLSILSLAYNLYLNYFSTLYKDVSPDPNIIDLTSFLEKADANDLLKIRDLLSEETSANNEETKKTKKVKEPEKELETSNIDPDISTKVALYKEHQASLLETENPHSVSETIKRARKTWFEREKVRLVYENTDKEKQKELEKKGEDQYRLSVNPKAESRKDILKNTYKFAEIALLAQGGKTLTTKQYDEALENIVYLAETGAIEIDNYNDLNIVSSLAIKEQTGKKTAYDEIDNLVQEKLIAEETDPYSDKADEINAKISRLNFDNNQSNKEFVHSLYIQDEDYDVFAGEAQKKEVSLVINKLSQAFPNAKLQFQQADPLSQKAQQLEKLIRTEYPSLLNTHPSGLGAKTSAALKETGGTKTSADAVDLYSKGLNPDKLREILEKRDSKTAEFLKNNRSLQKQIQYQLKQISNSPLGKELDGVYKKVNYLLDPIGSGRTYINHQIGKYAGKLIVKNTNSAVAKKFGNFVLENGLKGGAKKFADEVAKKLLVVAAKKAGVEAAKVAGMAAAESSIAAAAAALGVPTAGLSLIIGAVLIVGTIIIDVTFGLVKKGIQEIKNALGITKEDEEANKKALLIGLGALAATAFAVNRGAKMFGTATKAAVISAVGIIWLSLATIAVFLTLTFLTAPILTTLVQFDSEEKVEYDTLKEGSDTAQCNGKDLKNDKMSCSGDYCFPVNDKNTVSYLQYHHDYPANDIMRIGDKPGKGDDVPLPLLAYTGGYVLDATDDKIGGLSLIIAGDDGRFYYYAHNMCNTVQSGARVEAGDIVGGMDTSGNANGYLEHVHFHISTSPNMKTVPENYPNFIWPYEDFCKTVHICGSLNPDKYPELPYL